MKYSIVIPTYRRAKLLSATLNSLTCQSVGDFEVIVVCDGEDLETARFSKSYSAGYPLTWIFLAENQGAPTARNRGAREAQGEILLFLDDETAAAPDWLFQHARHHNVDDSTKTVVWGAIIELYERRPGSHTERLLRRDREQVLSRISARGRLLADDFDPFVVCGVNCSIRRCEFLSCGGFDEALREVAEDLELGARLYGKGVRFIHEPAARVYHRNTKDLEQHFAQVSRLAGAADTYRLQAKGQRNTQMRPLTLLHHGGFKSRLRHRLAWDHPNAVENVAGACRWLTDLTGSEFFFRRWRNSLSAARYWQGVRSRGLTLDEIGRLVGRSMPVLAFHSISVSDDRREGHCVRPQRFRRFMEWLRARQFQCVTPAEWLSGLAPPRSVCLTFDDGCEDFYFEVFPYVERWRLKPTVFLVVDRIGAMNSWDIAKGLCPRKLLSEQQIREMQRHGVQFGSHSLTHAWLPGISDAELYREVADSKSRLEDLLGTEVSCFAYPSGGLDPRVRSAVAAAGYRFAVTSNPGLSFWQDPLFVNRIGLGQRDGLLDFALKVTRGRSLKREIHYDLFQLAYAAAARLPDPLNRAARKSAQFLNITNPGAY